MTSESKQLIIKICKEKLWKEYRDPLSIVDEETKEKLRGIEIKARKNHDYLIIPTYPEDTASTKCVPVAFGTKKEAKNYFEEIQDIKIIDYSESFKVGEYYTFTNANVFNGIRLFGRYVFIEFDREYARNVFEHEYDDDVDFLTWVSNKGDEAWNELEGNPTLHEEFSGAKP